MHDKENDQLPAQIAFKGGKTCSDSKTTIGERRKLVGVVREGDASRLKALEYLGRRWLSHRQ